MRVWVGDCHLRAVDAGRRRWIGDRDEARGLMLFRAASRADYEQGLRAALARLGYDLRAVFQARPVEEARNLLGDADGLADLVPHVSRTRPLPLGGFAPVSPATVWREMGWDEVFAGGPPVWAVIDGVSWPEIQKVLHRTNARHTCLYSTLNPQSRALAPWLAQVEPGSAFARALQSHPQADHAYIILRSDADMDALRRHLRHFTMLRTPADKQSAVYFRFYDPRVLIDAMEAMRPSFVARFAEGISAFVAPLSPLCLSPASVEFAQQPVTPFTDDADCQGRLLSWSAPAFDGPRSGDLSVTDAEFAIFSQRMQRRATAKLARNLAQEHGDIADNARCLSVAAGASAQAPKYGMTTLKQVTTFARAMLFLGDDFATRDREAARMLNDPTLLPWQKKNQLARWIVKARRGRVLAGFEQG